MQRTHTNLFKWGEEKKQKDGKKFVRMHWKIVDSPTKNEKCEWAMQWTASTSRHVETTNKFRPEDIFTPQSDIRCRHYQFHTEPYTVKRLVVERHPSILLWSCEACTLCNESVWSENICLYSTLVQRFRNTVSTRKSAYRGEKWAPALKTYIQREYVWIN